MPPTSLLRYISFKHVRHQKARTIIAIFGICLGVASMVSIDIVNKSVLRSFEESINRVAGRAALQVTGPDSGFPEEMVERIQKVPGVELALPIIETTAAFSEGAGRSFMILGVDSLQDHQMRSYKLTDESADIPDLLIFLARSDSILLSKKMADREGIKIDQAIRIQTVQGIKTFYVRGLLNPDGPAGASGGDIAVMDVYAVQKVFGKAGKIDRVDMSFLPGAGLDVMKERIQAALPEGYYVDTPSGRSRQVENTTLRFRKSMGLVSFMALIVGMYLIYNTVAIAVVQRRKEIGIIRAVGGTRAQVVGLFLGETAVLSGIASLLGIGLGVLFAKLTVGVVAQSITDMAVRATVTELALSWPHVALDAGIGIAASVGAALLPAFNGANIAPISAIRSLPYSDDGFLTGNKIKLVSLFCFLAALATFLFYKNADAGSNMRSSSLVFLSMALLLLAISLVTPSFLKHYLRAFHNRVAKRFGAAGRLAGLNLQKNISRNAVAVAAVFFGIALSVGSSGLVHSMRISLNEYFDSIIRVDLMISSGNPLALGSSANVPMPFEMVGKIEKMPGILSAEPFRKVYVNYHGQRLLLEMFDVARRMKYCPGMIAQGTTDDIARLLPAQNNVAVNEGFAARNHVKPGDFITLPTPQGPQRFGVAAIVVCYESDAGTIWMDINTFQRIWRDGLVDIVEARVKPGTDLSLVSETILKQFSSERKLFVLPAHEFREEIRKILDRMFMVSNAVNVIALIIAGFGIIVTLLASVLERTREIGVLRSIGMKKSQVAGVVIIESMLLGLAGGLLGAATGILVGWFNVEGFFRADFGASTTYHVPLFSLVFAVMLAVALAALAGLYPAWRAARTNIVEALAYE
jgi:putative ABC transport system permease protein